MIKIAIMGAPSTGKTTLAKELSIHLLYRKGKLAEYIDEYARQFVARFGLPTIYDQYFFFEQQLKKEQAVSPKTERSRVKGSPPHWVLSTDVRPKSPPFMSRPMVKRPAIQE